MTPDDHVIRMPYPAEYRLHVGYCSCGIQFGYDARSYDAAVERARDHVSEALLAGVTGAAAE